MDQPQASVGDRYIPSRDSLNVDLSHHVLTQTTGAVSTPPLYKNMFSSSKVKVLEFKNKAPLPQRDLHSANKVLYSCPSRTRVTSKARHIPISPELTLEAPNIEDDFYLNLLDWSCNNILAVALKDEVFLWNGNDGTVDRINIESHSTTSVSSVRWTADGSHLAIGTNSNFIQLWDPSSHSLLRTLHGHKDRIGSLSWNKCLLSSGSRDCSIINHDVRVQQNVVSALNLHNSEVCGLLWSPYGKCLASGGNDNLVGLWDNRKFGSPLHRLTSHSSAVKALAWAPFQANLLATGGGTGDRHIRFWNSQSGVELCSIDTKSQICALEWSKNDSKELVSSHGYPNHQLMVWKYPSLKRIGGDLLGHTERVLHMSLSPDGTTTASAAADEKLCFWKVFTKQKRSRSAQKHDRAFSSSIALR